MAEPLKVGLAGLGTVGSAVVGMLARSARRARGPRRPADRSRGLCAPRTRRKDSRIDLSKLRKVDDPVALARDPGIDVFVELMGGEGDPAKSAVEAALGIGRPVVTANKALLAKHGVALAKLAEEKRRFASASRRPSPAAFRS